QIPFHGLAQAGFKCLARLPAELGGNECGIDRISQVVAGTIGDKCNQRFATADRLAGNEFIEQRANCLDDLQICPLAATADTVGLAGPSGADDRQKRSGVILDVQPVPNVAAGAVYRKLPALETVEDRQWDEFLGKMVGAIVVGAIGDQDGQAIGVMPTPNEVVGGSLRCGIG